MKIWNALALRFKLAILACAMLVTALATLGGVGYWLARDTIVTQVNFQLQSVARAQSNALERLISNTAETLQLYASDRSTAVAIRDFAKAFQSYDNPTAELQRLYITENPNPPGERDKLANINAMEPYHITHRRLHPTFDQLQDSLGLYDVFLFDDQGNLIYSVFKEMDYATNFLDGPWAETGLADAYRAAMKLPKGEPAALVDFQNYGPSGNAPAAFMALPVYYSTNEPIGVLAFQMPVTRMYQAIAGFSGVGESGNVLVYGDDGNLRLDGLRPDRGDVLATRFAGLQLSSTMLHQEGAVEFLDEFDTASLGYVHQTSFLGLSWHVVATQSRAEGLQNLDRLGRMFMTTGAVLALLSAVAAFILGRGVANPLVAIGASIRRLDQKDFSQKTPHVDRQDEIGSIASFMETLRGSLVLAEVQNHIARARSTAFMGSSSAMMVIDPDGVIELVNDAMTGLALANAAAFSSLDPDFDAAGLVGRNIATMHRSDALAQRLRDHGEASLFETILHLQGVSLGCKLAPILGEDARMTGMVLEWVDKTEELLNLDMASDQLRIELDGDGRIISVNENARHLLGGTKDALIGQDLGDACHLLSVGGAAPHCIMDDLSESQKQSGRFEISYHGTNIFADGTMLPMRNHEGAVTRVVIQATDVTADHVAQDQAQADRRAAHQAQQAVVGALSDALTQLANCDLSVQISQSMGHEYEAVRQNFNDALAILNRTIFTVANRATQVSESARNIRDGANNLSQRTEAQAVNLEETVTALAELTGLVDATTKNASETAEIVTQAREGAKKSGTIVKDAIAAMDAIESDSLEISSIVTVIDEIAFQTNLLALNAGVEAARAGDAGRGFAVVASEVRALAQRSSDAAQEISALISGSGKQIKDGVKMVSKAGAALDSIALSVTDIASKMERIAVDASAQSNSIGEINSAITDMDQLAQQNAAMFEQTTAATANLSDLSHELDVLTSKFTTADDKIAGTEDTQRLAG